MGAVWSIGALIFFPVFLFSILFTYIFLFVWVSFSMDFKPMLARVGDEGVLSREGYIFEPKMDGTRALCYKEGDVLRFVNRRGVDVGGRYPEFVFQKNIRAVSCVLDGEIVVYDESGRPSFRLLQSREQSAGGFLTGVRAGEYPATYVVFDILEKDGRNLFGLPLVERKKILDETVVDGKSIQKIFYTEDGRGLWKQVVKRKLEGVIAKQLDSPYFSGVRAPVWLKLKYVKTIDCVIVGYTSEKRVISALVLAVYEKGVLTYIGRTVGKGFTEDFLQGLRKMFAPLETNKPTVKYEGRKEIHWLKPKMVCEVSYLNLTKDLIMRAPVYQRLRFDKRPEDCVLEEQVVL